jgi:predicted HicB family RNase H-like nuclease
MKKSGEPPMLHRKLVIQAEEERISLDRLANAKLSQQLRLSLYF